MIAGSQESLYPGFESGLSPVVLELLRPEVAALVVVDVQNDYCHPDGALGGAGYDLSAIDPMCDVIEHLLSAARRSGVPVIFLRNQHSAATDSPAWLRRSKHSMEICREGTWGADFYRVSPQDQDVVIAKHRFSGFIGTRLPQVLAAIGRTSLVLTGTSTHVCVESTARDGAMLDYDIVVARDGVAATDQQAHETTLLNIDRFFGHVVSSSVVLDVWSGSQVRIA